MVGSGTPTPRRCHCLCRMLLWWSQGDGRSRGGGLPHTATMWVTAWAEAHPPEPRVRSLPALHALAELQLEITFLLHQ